MFKLIYDLDIMHRAKYFSYSRLEFSVCVSVTKSSDIEKLKCK